MKGDTLNLRFSRHEQWERLDYEDGEGLGVYQRIRPLGSFEVDGIVYVPPRCRSDYERRNGARSPGAMISMKYDFVGHGAMHWKPLPGSAEMRSLP